jgi:RecG-like helicase
MKNKVKFMFHVEHQDLYAVFLDEKRHKLLVDVYAQDEGLTRACTQYIEESREAAYSEYQDFLKLMIQNGHRLEVVSTQKIQGHRPPTKTEINFGYGAVHYMDFPISELIKKDGYLKSKITRDSLIYSFR